MSENNIRKQYLALKTHFRVNPDTQLNEKTLEIFLYLFKEIGMLNELVDLTQNWATYSGSASSHVKNYYLSEALFDLKAEGKMKFYSGMMNKIYEGVSSTNMLKLLSQVKAQLKEGSYEGA